VRLVGPGGVDVGAPDIRHRMAAVISKNLAILGRIAPRTAGLAAGETRKTLETSRVCKGTGLLAKGSVVGKHADALGVRSSPRALHG